MKISGNDIRPGNVVEHKGELWQAVKIQHTQPGKGGAYLQVELKGLTTRSKLNERFRSSETVEKVRLEMNPFQLMRSGEEEYQQLRVEEKKTKHDELLKLMVRHPILIERPIVVKDGKARIGRPPEAVLEIL